MLHVPAHSVDATVLNLLKGYMVYYSLSIPIIKYCSLTTPLCKFRDSQDLPKGSCTYTRIKKYSKVKLKQVNIYMGRDQNQNATQWATTKNL